MVANRLFHSEQIKACVQQALTTGVTTAEQLIDTAAIAALSVLQLRFANATSIVVFCGCGYNGGQGYRVALLAKDKGYRVEIRYQHPPNKLPQPLAALAMSAIKAGIVSQPLNSAIATHTDVIVDALIGIELNPLISNTLASTIKSINHSQKPILSLDIPSGLNPNTGMIASTSIKAWSTITFIGQKLGMLTLNGPDQCGLVDYHDLNLSHILTNYASAAEVLPDNLSELSLPKRHRNCHKGDFGRLLIVGGNHGMPGAVYLAAKAALRSGAGLVTIATKPCYANTINDLPEALLYGIDKPHVLRALIEKATVCVIGPGLGDDQWALDVLTIALEASIPLVIDGQALGLLPQLSHYHDHWILTPHPKEAAQLLSCSVETIQQDRYQSIKTLQHTYGGHIILKGAGSLIRTTEQKTYLCPWGNPGMATAGMGDVLAGIIGSLCAQQLLPSNAAKLGVWLHAMAGDLAANDGERGLLARDVIAKLRLVVNPMACR